MPPVASQQAAANCGFRLDTQADRHQRGHPPGGERGHGDHLGRRVHGQGGQQLLTLSGLGRPSFRAAPRRAAPPGGAAERPESEATHRQPSGRHRPPTPRGAPRPGWRTASTARASTANDGSGAIGVTRSYAVTQARQTQQPCRHPGRPVQQPGPLLLRRPRHHRLDQLAHHPERELPLQLGAARSQHPETLSPCRITGHRQQHGLADPSRPLHHQRPAVALLCPLQAPPDPLQFSVALEQQTVALALGRDHQPTLRRRPPGSPGWRRALSVRSGIGGCRQLRSCWRRTRPLWSSTRPAPFPTFPR